MCLLVTKPKNVSISEESLRNGYLTNSDGCGFAYAKDGNIFIEKGMFTFEDFYERYKQFEEFPMIIHFRLGTAGLKNADNCHPFGLLENKFALAHNGCLNIHLTDKNFSDTYHFAYQVVEPLLKDGVSPSSPSITYLIEQTIGAFNKIAILGQNGEITIYNEKSGHFDEKGVWWSNYSYKDYTSSFWRKKKKKSEKIIKIPIAPRKQEIKNFQKEYDDETELEIFFVMNNFQYNRQEAIDYLKKSDIKLIPLREISA